MSAVIPVCRLSKLTIASNSDTVICISSNKCLPPLNVNGKFPPNMATNIFHLLLNFYGESRVGR